MPRKRRPVKTPNTYKPETPLNRTNNNPRNRTSAHRQNVFMSANNISSSSTTHTVHKATKASEPNSQNASSSKNYNVNKQKSSFFAGPIQTSLKVKILIVAASVLLLVIAFDAILNSNKIYSGVSVGDVDVSGLTVEEATQKIDEHFGRLINNKSIYVFTDEEAYNSINIDDYFQAKDILAEQISAEEDARDTKIIARNAYEIGAFVDAQTLANKAYQIGKHFDYPARLKAWLCKDNISVNVSFGDGFDDLVNEMNSISGQPHIDYGVKLDGSEFVVTEGRDGEAINILKFSSAIENELLYSSDEVVKVYVAPEYDPIIIDERKASSVKDKLNSFCKQDATFTYNSKNADFKGKSLANWISTSIENGELKPYFDYSIFLKDIKTKFSDSGVINDVEIVDNNHGLQVNLKEDISVPDYASAINSLNDRLNKHDFNDENIRIEIQPSSKTNNFTFEEAINYGIIRKLSYYTTTYTSTRSTQNRNHNIHLVSDILNDTIIKPNDEFSFLGTAGEMTEEDGFLEAGAMSNGEVVQSVAGGVCQVATTVFNVAYDAGLDIRERHNHQMVISSYPTGLDAAVNVPDQDLRFVNDTTSDVLMTATYTDTSITISIYGTSEKRNVETDLTEFKTEKKYTTTYTETDQLAKDKWSIKTKGVDGSSITATRTVTLENGNILHKDAFYSYYIPTNEVVLVGEGSDISKIRSEREKSNDDD